LAGGKSLNRSDERLSRQAMPSILVKYRLRPYRRAIRRVLALQFGVVGVSVPAFQPSQGSFMDSAADRREARRFTMNLPLRILPWERKGDDLTVNMRDVSYRGLYFITSEQFEAGRDILFVITLPQDITKSGDVKIRCQGKVVRIDPSENGSVGVAAKIERYEFLHGMAVV
jgi:hypothetical protein